jgi:5'-3' exonuclease
MGIKKFTKVFPPNKDFKFENLKNKNIVIDASTEIYRAASQAFIGTLTDNKGYPTMHINTILLGIVLKLKKNDINQFWVFDYKEKDKNKKTFHIKLKETEILKRKNLKIKSKEKQKELEEERNNLFSSDEENDFTEEEQKELNNIKKYYDEEIKKQKRRNFTLSKFYTDDIIFILDMLDIPWISSPKGFEAEQICALSTQNKDIIGIKMDYVMSLDTDTLLFGAKNLIKRNLNAKTDSKKLTEYNLNKLLMDNDINQDDLIKIGVILGSDFAEKTKGVGEKTVLRKFKDITLTKKQQEAFNLFKQKISKNDIKEINVNNHNKIPFTNEKKFKQLLNWLQFVKCFNRIRIINSFHKAELFEEID